MKIYIQGYDFRMCIPNLILYNLSLLFVYFLTTYCLTTFQESKHSPLINSYILPHIYVKSQKIKILNLSVNNISRYYTDIESMKYTHIFVYMFQFSSFLQELFKRFNSDFRYCFHPNSTTPKPYLYCC